MIRLVWTGILFLWLPVALGQMNSALQSSAQATQSCRVEGTKL